MTVDRNEFDTPSSAWLSGRATDDEDARLGALVERDPAPFYTAPNEAVPGISSRIPFDWIGPAATLNAVDPVVRATQLEGQSNRTSTATAGAYVSALLRETVHQAPGFASDEPEIRLEQVAPGAWLAYFPASMSQEAVNFSVRDLAAELGATPIERERNGLTLAWPLPVSGLSAAVFGHTPRAIELDVACDPIGSAGVRVRVASRVTSRPSPSETAVADKLIPSVIRRIRALVRGPERRTTVRFPIARPTAIYPIELGSRGVHRPIHGVSADLSLSGARVVVEFASPCRFVYLRFLDVE